MYLLSIYLWFSGMFCLDHVQSSECSVSCHVVKTLDCSFISLSLNVHPLTERRVNCFTALSFLPNRKSHSLDSEVLAQTEQIKPQPDSVSEESRRFYYPPTDFLLRKVVTEDVERM